MAASASYSENAAPVTLSPAAAVRRRRQPDPAVGDGIDQRRRLCDGDVLTATTSGTTITASYNSATETLTLSGSDTLAHYQAVLDRVTFGRPASTRPTTAPTDPHRHLGAQRRQRLVQQHVATTTLSITAVNDPPTLGNVAATAAFTGTPRGDAVAGGHGHRPRQPDPRRATVKIAAALRGDGDVLATTTTGTSITASYNAATETLTLTGSDTLAHYQSVLDKVTFVVAGDNPTNYGADPTRTITWVLNDGSGSNNLSTVADHDGQHHGGRTTRRRWRSAATTASFTENGRAGDAVADRHGRRSPTT